MMLLASCPVFAYTDIGLLKTHKTFSGFLLAPTDSSDTSWGLAYCQKQTEKLAIEVSGILYNKTYPFAKSVTRIKIDAKYQASKFHAVTMTALAGPEIYYSMNTGAGLALDLGGIISVSNGAVATSLAMNSTLFQDGLGFDIEPMINYAPPFLKNTEIYIGYRMEGSMVGFSLTGISSGQTKYFTNLGLRMGL